MPIPCAKEHHRLGEAQNWWRSAILCLASLGASSIGCTKPDSDKLANTPATEYPAELGDTDTPSAMASPCPPGMAHLKNYCIDRYEAHLVLAESPDAIHSPYERPRHGQQYRAATAPGQVPQAYINRHEAELACTNSGKRLCTAREWQQACKGPTGTSYPYGALEIAGRCNTGKPHLPTKVFGGAAKSNMRAVFSDPRLNQTPGFLGKAGEYSGCVGQYGVFDLVGNLHEWVADPASSALANDMATASGAHHPGKRGNGVFLGGYFSSRGENGRGCEYVTAHHAPHYHDYSIGFRCCADANTTG